MGGFFFFFQAEDGIRDVAVTGVQTCALPIFFDPTRRYLTLETIVTILEGPDAPRQSLRLFQVMQQHMTPAPRPGHIMWAGQERSIDEFLRIMVTERRLIYQFEIRRAYGLV